MLCEGMLKCSAHCKHIILLFWEVRKIGVVYAYVTSLHLYCVNFIDEFSTL